MVRQSQLIDQLTALARGAQPPQGGGLSLDVPGLHTWQPGDGWHNLVPGQSTFAQAIVELGQPELVSQSSTEAVYSFLNKRVEITVDPISRVISAILILEPAARSTTKEIADLPISLHEAMAQFGPLAITAVTHDLELWYERPGFRLGCKPAPEPERINWIEFFKAD